MRTSGNREAAFIGRITADATHEIRNILAIVKESAGLIGDVVGGSGSEGLPHADRILRAVDRIDAQVARGADYLTHVNRFAHAVDSELDVIDLGEEVRQVAFLCRRMAGRRSQTVVAQDGSGAPPFRGSRLRVQLALYEAVAGLLEESWPGAVVTLAASGGGGVPAVALTAAGRDGPVPGALDESSAKRVAARLAESLGELAARVEVAGPGLGVRVRFDATE